ncbi:MAG: PLP-dependent aminotransferase family protein [Syntrophobacteraceae bacterium]
MLMQPGAASPYRYTLVGRHILDLIESGALKPGDRIPSLRRMSTTMRMSVTTVSQAYIELESQGIIESRPKSGFFVRPEYRQLLPPPVHEANPGLEPREINRFDLIRTVTELLGRRDILPFGVACPDASLLPAKDLSRILAAVVREDPARSVGYESVCGNVDLRKQIALLYMDIGLNVTPEDIIVTTGAMEGISVIMRCLTRPGDIVIIQSPTFYCFLQLLDTLGLRVIEVPSHPETGIDPEDVALAIKRYDVRACILNPNFNNPDGSLIPDGAKQEIVRLLGEKSIPLVEDDASGDLHFGPVRPEVCKKYDRKGLVALCSSFSKTISPGYRVGWLIPGQFFEPARRVKVTSSHCSATPTQMAMAEFLRTGKYDRHLKRLRAALEKHVHSMRLAISRYFPPETKVTGPSGGSVLWVELPRQIDSQEYFFEARERGIGLVPGIIFSTQDKYRNFIRLTCSGVWSPAIEEGIKALGKLASG